MSDTIVTTSPAFAVFCADRAEPDWLRAQREEAFARYEQMPAERLEKTDLTRRPWGSPAMPSAAVAVERTDYAQAVSLAPFTALAAGSPVIVFADGHVVSSHLPAHIAALGVKFGLLHSAEAGWAEQVRRHLGQVVSPTENKGTALNAAFWQDGVLLYVPRGVQVDETFVVVHVTRTEVAMPRLLVVAEENSHCRLADVYLAGEEAMKMPLAAVTEVVAGANATVEMVALSELGRGPTHLLTRRAKIGKDAAVNWVVADIGDGFCVSLVENVMEGSGSKSQVEGIGLGFGRQHMDLTVSMVHGGRYSESDIRLQGILRERANSIFRSSTHILQGAVGAGSEQHDRMMMLDTSARADAIPMLLIDENDVQRCGHAASVGKIDPNQIYYLMSRGIRREEAVRMILWGYLRPTVERIGYSPLQDWLVARLEGKLTS